MPVTRFAALLVALLPTLGFAQEPPGVIKARCALCHGEKGESGSEEFPVLAGQNENYLAKQLRDFKAGRREGLMQRFAKPLSEEDIVAIGRFYGSQKPGPHAPVDADLVAAGRYLYEKGNALSGVPACKMCHGEKAHGSETLPRLAGQHSPYTQRQIKEFGQRKRTNDNEVMLSVTEKLTPFEAKAVAEYLATLE
jgi:cytochrome c553